MPTPEEDAAFYSDAFFYAVDEEFRKAQAHKLVAVVDGNEDPAATRDKKRIRDKIRAAASSLHVASDGRSEDAADVMRRLAADALDRLAQAEPPWISTVDWPIILATFAQEAWPGLTTAPRLRRAAEDAVLKWRTARYGVTASCTTSQEVAASCGASEEVERVIEQFPPGMRLGVQLRDLRVISLMPGCAGEAVLDVGDCIVSVGGARVSTQDEFVAALEEARPGPLRIGVIPAQQDNHSSPGEVERIIAHLPVGTPLGVLWRGVCVAELAPGGAASAVLAVGDVVTSVNGRRLRTQDELQWFIDEARPGPVRLDVLPMVAQYVAPAPGGATQCQPLRQPPPPPPPPPPARASPSEVYERPLATAMDDTSHASPGRIVVVNCEDVVRTAARGRGAAAAWAAVGRVADYFRGLGLDVQLVVGREPALRDSPPERLQPMLVRCPVIDATGDVGARAREQSPVRVFVLRLAQEYGCQWVDNYDYDEAAWAGHASGLWLQSVGRALQMRYVFDHFDEFHPLENAAASATS